TCVKAIEWGGDVAGDALDVLCLKFVAERVSALAIEVKASHAVELFEFHNRANVPHVAPNTCHLKGGGEFVAVVRLVGVVYLVLGVAERRHAVDDAVKRVLALN